MIDAVRVRNVKGGIARVVYAVLAIALFAVGVALSRREDLSWWYLIAFAIAPDLTMLVGVRDSGKGRLSPKAVPYYNAAHRLIGPAVLGIAVAWFNPGLLVGALAWAGHVCFDRAIGIRLRAPDGSMRGES